MSDVDFGPCPHCQSREIVVHQSTASDGYGRSSISVGGLSSIPFSRVICLHCGLVREWVADRDHLNRLRKKFGRVPE
jgi:hypothetical protein